MFKELLQVMRPKQWYKNIVVFIAIFFSGQLLDFALLEYVILGFVSLCFLSSASYISNDILDMESDRHHDKKRNRPIASGALSVLFATFWAIILYLVGFVLAFLINHQFLLATLALVLLMHAYNLIFKNIAFADIAILSTNFVVRAIAGALAIGASISPWLLLGTYMLAVFLSTAKRKTDLESLQSQAKKYKKVFQIYTSELLDHFLLISGVALFMSYCLYSFLGTTIHALYVMATIPVVFFLIFRYYYFASSRSDIARNPEKVFTDKQMIAGMLLWFIMFFMSIYFI